jgi:pyruvate dehydrogenase kinase 2/3/4
MRRMLVSRISRRVLCEHHIALTEIFNKRRQEDSDEAQVGIIFTGMDVKRSIEKCAMLLSQKPGNLDGRQFNEKGKWPEVIVDGHLDTKFRYIREHFE